MITMFQMFRFTKSQIAAVAQPEAKPFVTKKPMPDLDFSTPKEEESPKTFSCLDELFGEMIEEQKRFALNE